MVFSDSLEGSVGRSLGYGRDSISSVPSRSPARCSLGIVVSSLLVLTRTMIPLRKLAGTSDYDAPHSDKRYPLIGCHDGPYSIEWAVDPSLSSMLHLSSSGKKTTRHRCHITHCILPRALRARLCNPIEHSGFESASAFVNESPQMEYNHLCVLTLNCLVFDWGGRRRTSCTDGPSEVTLPWSRERERIAAASTFQRGEKVIVAKRG